MCAFLDIAVPSAKLEPNVGLPSGPGDIPIPDSPTSRLLMCDEAKYANQDAKPKPSSGPEKTRVYQAQEAAVLTETAKALTSILSSAQRKYETNLFTRPH
jgi:hypothetical protein